MDPKSVPIFHLIIACVHEIDTNLREIMGSYRESLSHKLCRETRSPDVRDVETVQEL